MKEKFKLTPLEKHWVLYDIGNSAFILLVSTLIPIYFGALADAGGLTAEQNLGYFSYAVSVATFLVALIAPICGTMADQSGFKKPLFLTCLAIGVLGCAVLGISRSWLTFLVIFVIAKVGYSASNVFYDSMLPEITARERMDNVSSRGYAYGYIGSVIPFILCLLVVLFSDKLGISTTTGMNIAFLITALWWLGCTLPLAKSYRQTAFAPKKGNALAETFRRLGRSFRDVRKEKHIFLYLLAFFFFIDGVYTIINLATSYGEAMGLPATSLLLALLLTQFVAFPCSILFGRLSAKYDTGLLIKVCIAAYTGITLFAMFLQLEWQFWVLATLVGMFQGGIQALSRSYLAKIIPAERSGEYFGLMDICGKGASFVGSTMVGWVTLQTAGMTWDFFGYEMQNEGMAVGTLVILFAIGYVLFCKADKLNKARSVG